MLNVDKEFSMNKKFLILPAVLLALAACGDDSSSTEVDENENFTTEGGPSAVTYNGNGIYYTGKAFFENDSAKKTISVYKPVCAVRDGELFWAAGDEKAKPFTVTYKYNESSKSINAQYDGEKYSMKFYGDKFPFGQWIEPDADDGDIYNGFSLDTNGVFGYTKFFGDSCLVDNLVALHGILGIDGMDKVEKVDCNTAKYNGATISYEKYSAGKASFTVEKDGEECSVSFTPRFAVYEDDCEAAYDEFKDSDAEEFNFEDFSVKVSGDVECFGEMFK